MTSKLQNLADLEPSGPGTKTAVIQTVEVKGFTANSTMKDKLMAFGIIPGIKVHCESQIPLSGARVYQFETWRGVLRKEEAREIVVTVPGSLLVCDASNDADSVPKSESEAAERPTKIGSTND